MDSYAEANVGSYTDWMGWFLTKALSFTLVAQRIKQAPVDVVGLEFE
jgi:hypothetical protein